MRTAFLPILSHIVISFFQKQCGEFQIQLSAGERKRRVKKTVEGEGRGGGGVQKGLSAFLEGNDFVSQSQ